MARIWIKLWTEALNDPKMGALPDRLYRRVIECIMLAGQIDRDGEIGTTAEIAWALRVSAGDLEKELAELAQIGILQKTSAGWLVSKFSARQARIPDVERKRQERTRARQEQYYDDDEQDDTETEEDVTDEVTEEVTPTSQECHADVTKCDTEEKRREEKRREENRTDGASSAPFEKVYRAWQYYERDLHKTIPKTVYDRYLANTEPVGYEDGLVIMGTDHEGNVPWLEANLAVQLAGYFRGAMGRPVQVRFTAEAWVTT